jgi:hypothetical protein
MYFKDYNDKDMICFKKKIVYTCFLKRIES